MKSCKHGHPLTEENLYRYEVRSSTGRVYQRGKCKTCHRASARVWCAGKAKPELTAGGLSVAHRIEELEREWWNSPAWRRKEIELELKEVSLR
ncbi:MAG: hypothetical protein KDE27_20195 [Planctomycetes bacterium]|nr:hypothetical protein [Planctomycetota bacterium]